MKYIAKIPGDNIDEDNIRWLIIEPHLHNGEIVGYFMYFNENLNESKWDNWYQNLETAFETGEAYGIGRTDWKIYDNII